MKQCGYCGRQNTQEAVYCYECGLELNPPRPDAAQEATWLVWVWRPLRYIVLLIVCCAFYLLSFGPMARYFGRQTVTIAPAGGGLTLQTATYPLWVGIVYHPAVVLRSLSGGNNLYSDYLGWWERARP
jgi:hypothetical protein